MLHGFSRIKVIATIITLLVPVIAENTRTTHYCDETGDVYVVRDDKPVNRVLAHRNGVLSVTKLGNTRWIPGLPPSIGGKSYAGEHGIVIKHSGRRALVIPVGLNNSLYMFDIDTEEWTSVGVYCKPVGVAFSDQSGEIAGFCAVNYTIGRRPCVPVFKVHRLQGQWISEQGSCIHGLTTTNLTNPVILKYSTLYNPTAVELYFVEQQVNRLHVINLVQQTSKYYDIPLNYSDSVLMIDPMVTNDFIGIHIQSSGNFHNIDHVLFSSTTQSFTQNFPQTVTIAFFSYSLDYLVSFGADHREIIIYKDDGTRKHLKLLSAVDDRIECKNMARPGHNYLICLAQHGHAVHLINITRYALTDDIVHGDGAYIVHIGMVGNMFYLINQQKQMSFYSIVGSSGVTQMAVLLNHTANVRIMNSAAGCQGVDQSNELDIISKVVVINNKFNAPSSTPISPKVISDNQETSNTHHPLGILILISVGSLTLLIVILTTFVAFIFIVRHCRHITATKSPSVSTISSDNVAQPSTEETIQAHDTIDPQNAPIQLVNLLGELAPTNQQHCTTEEPEQFVEDVEVREPVRCTSPSRSLSSVATTTPDGADSYV